MMVTGLVALALFVVLGLSAWEVWADLCDARREIDRLQARVDQDEYVISELRLRVAALSREGANE